MSWTPPEYRVGPDGKVIGVTPPEPNNWGRWGSADQRGTANLITPERVAGAAALIKTGVSYSLAIPIDGRAPAHPSRLRPTRLNALSGSDYVAGFSLPAPAFVRGVKFTDDVLIMNLQGSTQWDGLAHVIRDETIYNGFWGGSVTAAAGAEFNGVHNLRESLIGRGVLLDVCAAAGGTPLPAGHRIDAAALAAAAEVQGVELRSGDILLVRTGYLGAWYASTDPVLRGGRWFEEEPGLALDSIEWLHQQDAAAVACDNWGVEVVPFEEPDGKAMPFHQAAIPGLGLTLGEYFWLDDLAAACAADNRWDFFLAAQPLNVTNASGTPLNPVAIR
jgi:kynurenine formamidase